MENAPNYVLILAFTHKYKDKKSPKKLVNVRFRFFKRIESYLYPHFKRMICPSLPSSGVKIGQGSKIKSEVKLQYLSTRSRSILNRSMSLPHPLSTRYKINRMPKDLISIRNKVYMTCSSDLHQNPNHRQHCPPAHPYHSHSIQKIHNNFPATNLPHQLQLTTIDNNHHHYYESSLRLVDCRTCRTRSDSPLTFYRHLASPLHTSNSLRRDSGPPVKLGNMILTLPEFLMWGKQDNERTIVVTSLKCATNSKRLLFHFLKFGRVTDYVADPEGHFAIIQYYHKYCIKNILEDCNSTRIDGGYVRVRCKDCVSFIEWAILLDLDGIYEKSDQPFFIHHCVQMSAFSGLGIHHQFLYFLEESTLKKKGTRAQRSLTKYLGHLLFPIFPNMTFNPLVPIIFDGNDPILEIFMDPLGDTRSPEHFESLIENSPPFHHAPQYQEAIGRVRHVLRHQSDLLEFADEVGSLPDGQCDPCRPVPYDALRFNHCGSGMKCKISFDDPLAPCVTFLFELMSQIQPSFIPVLRFVQYWARIHRFEVRHTASRTGMDMVLSMLVLVYFMKINFLPSVKALRKLSKYVENSDDDSKPKRYVQGWKIDLCSDLPTILDYLKRRGKYIPKEQPQDEESQKNGNEAFSNEEDISFPGECDNVREIFIHLKNFFGSFSWIDFGCCVISPHFGDLVLKSDRRISKPKRSEPLKSFPPPFRQDPLIVQHPFDLRRNIAAAFDEVLVNRMQIQFRNTYQRVDALLKSSAPRMRDLFPEFHKILRWEPYHFPGVEGEGSSNVDLDTTSSSGDSDSDSELEAACGDVNADGGKSDEIG